LERMWSSSLWWSNFIRCICNSVEYIGFGNASCFQIHSTWNNMK
jgi:hypothetical protein